MRSGLILVVAIVVAALTPAGAALAQGSRSAPSEKAAPKKVVRNVSGAVRAASNEAVVVLGRDKGRETEWTFAVEPTTNIRKGARSIVGGDLKPGDAVQVRFTERDGKAVAEAILVKTPKRASTPKK